MKNLRLLIGYLFILMAGCTAHAQPAHSPCEDESATGEAGDELADDSESDGSAEIPEGYRAAESCPTTLHDADGQECVGGTACVYGIGNCYCHLPPHCGGARARPHPEGTPGNFYCQSEEPRPGTDCPYSMPTDGDACDPDGTHCAWGVCNWNQTKGTCVDGQWVLKRYDGPPPP